jgi:DNA-binding PadR family transcriptional regulator
VAKLTPSQTDKERHTRQALQREVLYFLTEQGPASWAALRIGFDEHGTTIVPVLRQMKKYKLIECDSTDTVRITFLGSEYLKRD